MAESNIEYRIGGIGPIAGYEFVNSSDGALTGGPGSDVTSRPMTIGYITRAEGDSFPFTARIRARGAAADSAVIVAIYRNGERVAVASAAGNKDAAVCTYRVAD